MTGSIGRRRILQLGAGALVAGLAPVLTAARAAGSGPDLSSVTLRAAQYTGGDISKMMAAAGVLDTPYRLQFSTFASGNLIVEALNAGALDVGGMSEIPPVFGAISGAAVKIVAILQQDTDWQVVLVPKDSPARTIADLRGKRIGISSGETEDVWAIAKVEAAKRGLDVRLVPFNDYTQPNEALETGDLDANAFQHRPYLDNQIKARGYHIVLVGYTALWPIGLYARKHKAIGDLPRGAVVGVPNDPSNEGRALRLLELNGLIKLRPSAGILATKADITENPKNLVIKELDAGIVGRSIDDLDAAVVNTDWALKSGLGQGERIATEPVLDNPYRNLIAVKAGHESDPWVKPLVASFQTDAVRDALKTAFKGTAVAAW